jgi:hypothetical protein
MRLMVRDQWTADDRVLQVQNEPIAEQAANDRQNTRVGGELDKSEIVKERGAANVRILDRVQGIPTKCPLLFEVDLVDSDPPMR